MSPAKTLFRDIAKQVHPDVNGGTVNSTKMMQEAIKHRNNGDMLLNLARKWGLNINGSFDAKAFDGHDFDEKVFDIVVGAIVKYGFQHNRKMKTIRGVLFNIRVITSGYLKGAKEYSIYDFATQVIWKHKSYDIPGFKVVGMASPEDLQEGRDRQKRIKDIKKARNDYRGKTARIKFVALGLRSNKNYSGKEVLIEYRGGEKWKKLIRTTPKCVFIEEYPYSKPRMVKIASVLDVRSY